MTESTPFDHVDVPRPTDFRISGEPTLQDIYAAMATDEARNRGIADDVTRTVEQGRSPLVLTRRTEHLAQIENALGDRVRNIVVLKGGMGRKQRPEVNERLAAIPESEQRTILTTGSYIGEGFDDARLDTLFLAMPISWKGTLQQYVGRLHGFTTERRSSRCTTTSMPTSRCSHACMAVDCQMLSATSICDSRFLVRSLSAISPIAYGSTASEQIFKPLSAACVRRVCELRQTRTLSAHKKRKRPPVEGA